MKIIIHNRWQSYGEYRWPVVWTAMGYCGLWYCKETRLLPAIRQLHQRSLLVAAAGERKKENEILESEILESRNKKPAWMNKEMKKNNERVQKWIKLWSTHPVWSGAVHDITFAFFTSFLSDFTVHVQLSLLVCALKKEACDPSNWYILTQTVIQRLTHPH